MTANSFYPTLTDEAVLHLLGRRVESQRLHLNRTQALVADEAGVSESTVRRLEGGSSIQLDKLVRILRSLDLLSNLDRLVPEPPANPVAMARMQGAKRKRARGKRTEAPKPTGDWKWGDEE